MKVGRNRSRDGNYLNLYGNLKRRTNVGIFGFFGFFGFFANRTIISLVLDPVVYSEGVQLCVDALVECSSGCLHMILASLELAPPALDKMVSAIFAFLAYGVEFEWLSNQILFILFIYLFIYKIVPVGLCNGLYSPTF